VIEIAIANEQASLEVRESRLQDAIRAVFADAQITQATVSIAIVDDATMHDLNRRFLDHDYPTDVLSFVLEQTGSTLDGEIIVSADYALRSAHEYLWSADDELLLYVIHGALHLVGYDDLDSTSKSEMQEQERHYLGKFNITPPDVPRGRNEQ
jgi:probable rRNA maturation factor